MKNQDLCAGRDHLLRLAIFFTTLFLRLSRYVAKFAKTDSEPTLEDGVFVVVVVVAHAASSAASPSEDAPAPRIIIHTILLFV
jgi:hypothetical protein